MTELLGPKMQIESTPMSLELYYYNYPNFGDQLNVIILEKLFNEVVVEAPYTTADMVAIGSVLDCFFVEGLASQEQKEAQYLCDRENPVHAWGTGLIKSYDSGITPLRPMVVHALRGTLTRQILELSLKAKITCPLADPGLLARRLLDEPVEKRFQIGIIPHQAESGEPIFQTMTENYGDAVLIDVCQDPQEVIKQIAECECILSSSLHGLIVADSLGIPGQWCVLTDRVIGNGFKFYDYYSAFGIKAKPYDLAKQPPPTPSQIISSYVIQPEQLLLKEKELLDSYKSFKDFVDNKKCNQDVSSSCFLAGLTDMTATNEPKTLPDGFSSGGSDVEAAIKVSVVVPVYNAERFLRECLDSILGQTLQEVEVLCIDDASTDNSLQILKEYAESDSRVRVLEQPYNQFAGAARNRGIDEARGKYLIFWDADDFFEPDALERMYLQSELHSAEICVCGARVYDMKTGRLVSANHCLDLKHLPLELPFSSRSYPESAFSFTSPGPFNKLFLKEFIMRENLQFSSLPRCEDLPFVLLSIALANRITAVDRILINYRRGTATSSQETVSESPFSFYEALQELRQGLIDRALFQQAEKAFAVISLSNCLYNLSLQKTKELWLSVALRLKNEILEELGCSQHPKSLFPNQGQYDRMMLLIETSPEDLVAHEPELRSDERDNEAQQKLGEKEGRCIKSSESEGSQNPTETIKVSVVIAGYNTEDYLEECLRSVMRQTLKEIEIICVDDGSTDGSMLILERLGQEDNRIQILHQENRGVSIARNNGLGRARGEYIYFLDSDDYIVQCALEHIYFEAKQDSLDVLFFEAESFFDPIELYKEFSSYRTYYHYKMDYGPASSGQDLFIRLRKEPWEFKPSGCAQLFRRAFLEENKITFYPGILHEDNLFTLQCLMLAKRAKVLREPLYMRRVRPSSIMTSEKTWKNVYGILTCIYESGISAIELGIADSDFIEALTHCQLIMGWQTEKVLRGLSWEDINSRIAEVPLEKRHGLVLLIKNIQQVDSLKAQIEVLRKRVSDLQTQSNSMDKCAKEAGERAEKAEAQAKEAGERAEKAETQAKKSNDEAASAEKRAEDAERRTEEANKLLNSEKKKAASLEKRLTKVQNSRSYRLGRFLTSPVRLARRILK